MASTTIYGSTSDGYLTKAYTLQYAEARDATTADSEGTGYDYLPVGWHIDTNGLYRSYLYFDTSSLPDNATITAATLSLYLYYEDSIPEGHQIILQLGDPTTYPHDPLALGDFDRTQYKSGGADNITVYSGQTGWMTFTLNSTGYGWINLAGYTNFCLRSEFDVSPSLPQYGMYCWFYSSDKGTGYQPKLDITYGLKAEVTTNAASGIGSVEVTGNGTINSGTGITEYGFIWNDDGSDPVNLASADNKQISSNLSGGVFSATLTGLDSDSLYYYRAYATNDVGTGYGSAAAFTTATAPDVLSIETDAASSITDTTVTLNGDITANPSGSITQHGFVWQQGQDPGTGPYTGASGYVELGSGATGSFATGVTGLTSGSGYLYRSYLTTGGGQLFGNARIFRTGTPASTTVTGATGDGSLYTYGIWGQSSECYQVDASHCIDKATAEIESSTCDDNGGPWSYPDRAVKITDETETDLYSWCDADGGYCNDCHIVRGYLYFDTSGLSGKEITSATLKLYVTYSQYYDGYNAHGQGVELGYSASYPSESGGNPALDASDFAYWNYTWFTYVSSDTMENTYGAPGTINQYVTFSIPTSYINKSGLTKFAVRLVDRAEIYGDRDMSHHLKYQTADGTNKPYLDIDYIEPEEGPALPSVNVGGTWKAGEEALINVGDKWRLVDDMKINVGDTWESVV